MNITEERLRAFVEKLAGTCVPANSTNLYSYACKENGMRRQNLLIYLREMAGRQPNVMLVGEAPGYRGCRMTGVPFTSERILLEGVGSGLFGREKGYRLTCHAGALGREQTASIMWEVLGATGLEALAWNSYPFHPFKTGNEDSNRAPSAAEMRLGAQFLKMLIDMFQVRSVVAVGNKAATALTYAGIDAYKVRHPSHGGKAEFAKGIWRIAGAGAESAPEGAIWDPARS